MTLKERSTGLIATVNNSTEFVKLERSLTINKIIETALPISVVKKNVPEGDIEISIDIALTRLVESLNLKWNLTGGQTKTIVEDLVDKYPNETIEDFILIFKRARQGEFGELYRLDSAVIFGWMERYLEEKYEALERSLYTEKETFNKPIKPVCEADRLAVWKASVDAITVKAIAPLTTKEVITEGQEKPKRQSYPMTSESERLKHERHLQYIRENYDARTGEPIKGVWVKESDWQINNGYVETN